MPREIRHPRLKTIVIRIRLFQQHRELAASVMLLLIIDVPIDLRYFIFTQRQYAVTFLPAEFEFRLDLSVDAKGKRAFHLADKLAGRNGRR